MKMFVLKLISLLVLLVGGLILAACFDVPEAKEALQCTHACLVKNVAAPGEGGQAGAGQWAAGAVLLLVGLYGFLPRLPKRDKRRTVAYSLEHGDVVVALDPAQATLNEVIRALPEVKKICIKITAAEDRRKVKIESEAVLNTQIGATAQESRDLINQCILDTATDMLGLEVLGPINLKVKGAEIDVRAASESLREKHLSEIQAKQAAATAAAPAVIPAVVPPSEVIPAIPEEDPVPEADLTTTPETAPESDIPEVDLSSILEDDTEKTDASLNTGFVPEAHPEEEVFPAGDMDEDDGVIGDEVELEDAAEEDSGVEEDEDKKEDDDPITF